MGLTEELAPLDATAQAQLLARKEITALEAVDAAIERIEVMNGELNAVTIPLFDAARERAQSRPGTPGPFDGVPIVLKDTTPAKGEPLERATRKLHDAKAIADHDSNVIRKLRDAGFISLGRSNLPELAAAITTEPVLYGPCRNPWSLEHSVGGSSGGSACAVAAGLVPLAHGADGGGSVRIPSSLCGLVGLKPTRGRVSHGPDFSDTEGFSVTSVLTRSVRDTARAIDALSGYVAGDPWIAPALPMSLADAMTREPRRLRIGLWQPPTDRTQSVHPECLDAAAHTASLLEGLGHSVELAHPPSFGDDPDAFFVVAVTIMASELSDIEHQTGSEVTEADVEPHVWAAAQAGRQVSSLMYVEAIAELRAYSTGIAQWFESGWDLILSPTLAQPPWLLGSTSSPAPGEPWPDVRPWIPFTASFNITGLPAISLPIWWTKSGLPVGVQLGAALGREDLLISVAAQLEEAAPWKDKWPPHSFVTRSKNNG